MGGGFEGKKPGGSSLVQRALEGGGQTSAAGAVGKRPLVESVGDDSAVPQAAAKGVASGGGPLPHGDTIQRLFGRHDIGGVEAHVGGAAETATRAIGAEAYATGNHVAFAGAPDLHTAAHEAAHVVQQRAGVQLAGGVGKTGDAYEQHADKVADAVVTGTSAEGLLDQMATSRGSGAAIQRIPEPTAAFVAQWFQDHVVLGNAEIQSISTLPQPQHDAVLNEVRRRYGNEYIRRGQAGTLPATPGEPNDAPTPAPLTALEYWKKYGKTTLRDASTRALGELDFEITGPGLTFKPEDRGPFVLYALGWQMNDDDPDHVTQLLETSIEQLIDSVRILDALDQATDAYEPAVVERILERLEIGVKKATARLALPYAKARSQVITDAEARGDQSSGFPGLDAPSPEIDALQPSSTSLGARTSIEHAVADAMCHGFVGFDKAGFGKMFDTTIPGEAKAGVVLELERGNGDWRTVRVVKPSSVTAADVASALFGGPQFANLVVGNGDRYSFVFPPGGGLAEPYQSWWHGNMDDDGASVLDKYFSRTATDPVASLDPELADQRALESAGDSKGDGQGAAPVLLRIDIIQSTLDGIADAALPLGLAPAVAPMRAHVAERRARCIADPSEAEKWAAQSAGQLDLLTEAKTGFDAVTKQAFAMGIPAVSTADGDQLVGDATAAMKGPLQEVADAYATAVAGSDQLDLGRERLAIAKERLATYPFDMVDRMLAMVRRRLETTAHSAAVPMQSYEKARIDAMQNEISTTVAGLRMAVVNGDGTATLKLQSLQSKLAMLDLQSSLGSTLSAINELEGQLHNSESWLPDEERELEIRKELEAALQPWRNLAETYDKAWQSGHDQDPAWIAYVRSEIARLRKQTKISELVNEVATFAEDEAKRQKWIAIGVMIGAALAAILTGGLASGAVGGGIAGAIVGGAFEALTFTAITSTLSQDQTFGGFMAELTVNFFTFGGLRVISEGAKLMAAGRVLTLSEKFGEMTLEGLWMVASVKAQEIIEAQLGSGQVTTQGAAKVFGEQMLISFAGRAVGRIVGFAKMMRGTEKLEKVRLALEAGNEAKALHDGVLAGDYTQGKQVVASDTAALRAETTALDEVSKLAGDPAAAAKHGIDLDPATAAEIHQAAAGAQRELNEREIAALMAQTTPHGDHFIAEPHVYDELLAKHRAQGSTIVESYGSGNHPTATITPTLADGSIGAKITIHSDLGEEVNKILKDKGLPNDAIVGDYLAKRSGDRAGAIADLQKIQSKAELDSLMEKTLGKDAVEARTQSLSAHEAAKPQTSPPPPPPPPPPLPPLNAEEAAVKQAFDPVGGISDPAIRALAGVPRVDAATLASLVARGPVAAEELAQALSKVGHWPDNARTGLFKLATAATADQMRIYAKALTSLEIDGMNTWVTLASRQLHNPVKVLELEASLDKAIQMRRVDPQVALEVDYYKGKRITRDELNVERASATFDKEEHNNLDVEGNNERWEMKRVDPVITTSNKFVSQMSEGVAKFTDTGLPSLKRGGTKKNFVDVSFGNRFQIAGGDRAWIEARVQDYIRNNKNAAAHVDAFVIHVELSGANVDILVEVP